MQADFPVVLDACVLVPPRLCDLLLRLAEHPRMYLPKWSAEILVEVRRTQINKLKPPFSEDLAEYWHQEVTRTFPEAMITGYEHLIQFMENDEKDRHVLASAVHDKASLIVTSNQKDFPSENLDPWGVEAKHPQDFVLNLYEINPPVVVGKLVKMAEDTDEALGDMLLQLGKTIPEFATRILDDLNLSSET